MAVELIDPLDPQQLALRTLQCPDHIQPNDALDAYRVSSAAFGMGTDGTLSIDLGESLLRSGLSLTARYGSLRASVGMVSHKVADYQANDFHVIHDPVAGNDHHGTVTTSLKNKAARKRARDMAEISSFVIPINYEAALQHGAKPLPNRKT